MLRLTAVVALLFTAVLLAASSTRISIRVARSVAATDSLLAAAIGIEPALASSRARNSKYITLSYAAGSLADTLRFNDLRLNGGVELFWSVDSGGG